MSGPRPDLVAAWAVALGIFLILVASATSQGASTGGAPAGALGPQPPSSQAAVAPANSADQRTARSLQDFQSSLGLPPTGPVSASARRAVVSRMAVEAATWYGPGFYGRRTACGLRLGRLLEGVAHRKLPCGTPVTFYYRGVFKTVPVVDRGPYARGISWDLTAAAASALGVGQTGRLRVIH